MKDKLNNEGYIECIKISTEASLKEMILPGVMVIFTPLVVGGLFGPKAVSGYLAGVIVSGVQMAISSSNSGGAWDNAKKFIEGGKLQIGKFGQKITSQQQVDNYPDLKSEQEELKKQLEEIESRKYFNERKEVDSHPINYIKKTKPHESAVIGDTVGDPLKDTSGPSLNILIKLSAIVSLIFGSFFANHSVFNF